MQMSKALKWTVPGSLGLLFIALALVLSSCSTNAPTAPSSSEYDIEQSMNAVAFVDSLMTTPDGLATGSGLDYLKYSPYYIADASAKNEFDVDGGTLKLQLVDEVITFVVPEDAVDRKVVIEIVGFKLSTPYGHVFLYECSPSGLELDEPIWVNHPVGKRDGSAAALIFLDESGRESERVLEQVSPVEDGRALFEIHHFSKYGIS